jgi:thioesterase domain-containing protein
VRAASRLAEAGLAVPVSALFRHPTLEGLAAHVALRVGETTTEAAVEVRDGRDPPLFVVHDGSGLLVYAHRLAERLAADNAIVGLPAVVPGAAQPADVPAMGDRLLAMVRVRQPRGPYRLLGWSFGGLLAWELAARLTASGDTVEFIALLDSPCPAALPRRAARLHDEKEHLLDLMQVEAIGNPRLQQALEALKRDVDGLDLGGLLRRADATRLALTPPWLRDLPEPDVARYLHRQQAFHAAAIAYRPPPLPLAVHLFRAGDEPLSAAAGWRDVLPPERLHEVVVRGDHHSMLRDGNLVALAAALDAALRGERRAP